MTGEGSLSRFKCHKEVMACLISAIEFAEDGSAKIAPKGANLDVIKTDAGFRQRFRGTEEDLGYFVLYEDGYQSWSPSKAFREGYSLML